MTSRIIAITRRRSVSSVCIIVINRVGGRIWISRRSIAVWISIMCATVNWMSVVGMYIMRMPVILMKVSMWVRKRRNTH
jgi:hypothetical protein